MGLSYLDAYAKIKALENDAQLPLNAPTDAIVVGSVDARSGAFTFAVPTMRQTISEQPQGGRPSGPIELTVGIVATNCVNLTLIFDVTNAQWDNASTDGHRVVRHGGIGGGGIGGAGSTGDVTISGFPTSGTHGSRIYLNAGLSASSMLNSQNVTPPVENFSIGITVHGQLTYQHIVILRPPVLGVGAFTIPALPVAIIFAPPQGQLGKNSNTFQDKSAVSTTTTVSFVKQTDKKTAQAYTQAELAGKVANLLAQIAAMIAGFSGLETTSGGSPMLINVISGPPGGGTLTGVDEQSQGKSATLGDTLKAFGSGFALAADILDGFTDANNSSDTSSIITQTNNTMTISMTYTDNYGTEAGKGPGVGDRFLYLEDVRAIWANINGQVGVIVMGYKGVGAWSGDALSADLKALASGGTATSGLDANTIQLLLDLDPYYLVPPVRNIGSVNPGPPLLGLPRFTPMNPLNRNGAGTTANGDSFSLANETITDKSTTNTSKTINVTDAKPGWINVLMGEDDVETNTTVTVTNTVTSDQKTDETITNTITMMSTGAGDRYNINLYFDNFSQTLVPVSPDSPVLQGSTVIGAS